MPYKVVKQEPKDEASESPTKGFAQVKQELKNYTGGDPVMGVIGEVKPEPEIVEEDLSSEDEERRLAYISLLQGVLLPHKLGKLTSIDENRERLFSKLDRLTLDELKKFVPSKVKVGKVDTQSIPTNIRAEINMRYRNISP